MSGTSEGSKLAAKKIKDKYGNDFYMRIGRQGGAKGRTGGFFHSKNYSLDHPAHPANAGRKGGTISKRPKDKG